MIKIYLAMGHKDLENFIINHKPLLEKELKDSIEFVGRAVYREATLQGVKDTKPDILMLRESLQGKLNISDLIYDIKVSSSKTRIIVLTGDRSIGDPFLASLVNWGVYDLLIGNKVNTKELLKSIVYPKEFSDVAMYAPKATINENTNQVVYEQPIIPTQKVETKEEEQFDRKIEQVTATKPIKINEVNPIKKEKPKQKKSLFGRKIDPKQLISKLLHLLEEVRVLEIHILLLIQLLIWQMKDLIYCIWI